MASRGSPTTVLPGPPQQTELAYLAGLVDRAGGFMASRPNAIGLKIVCGPTLRNWLVMRFGGHDSSRAWTVTRQADLGFLLPRLLPYLVTRSAECSAMIALVGHVSSRPTYRPDQDWKTERTRLMDAVRALHQARGSRSPARPTQSTPRP